MLFLQARIFRAGQEMLSTKELMTVPIRPLVDRTYLEQVLLSRFPTVRYSSGSRNTFSPTVS